MDPTRRTRIGLWVLFAPSALTGLWAVFAPSSWYSDFGGGVAPPSAFGAYNEHFVQDLGGGYLGVAAVLAYAAVRLSRPLVEGALIAFAVFTVPHLVIHVVERGDLDAAGYWSTVGSLGFGIVVAAWAWQQARSLGRTEHPVGATRGG